MAGGFLLLFLNVLRQSIGYWLNNTPFEFYTVFYSDFTFVMSVLLFMWAKYTTFTASVLTKLLFFAAPYTFGVYLIHDNKGMREWLWNGLFDIPDYSTSGYFVFYILGISVFIFFVCVCVDYCRHKLFTVLSVDKLIMKLCDKLPYMMK